MEIASYIYMLFPAIKVLFFPLFLKKKIGKNGEVIYIPLFLTPKNLQVEKTILNFVYYGL